MCFSATPSIRLTLTYPCWAYKSVLYVFISIPALRNCFGCRTMFGCPYLSFNKDLERRQDLPKNYLQRQVICRITISLFAPPARDLSSVQSLSHVWLFATPWITARKASLSITNSRILLKLMPIESVMPSNHLIFCPPLLLSPTIIPASGSTPMSQFFTSGGQSIGVSASA